jgi:hypothetical protein
VINAFGLGQHLHPHCNANQVQSQERSATGVTATPIRAGLPSPRASPFEPARVTIAPLGTNGHIVFTDGDHVSRLTCGCKQLRQHDRLARRPASKWKAERDYVAPADLTAYCLALSVGRPRRRQPKEGHHARRALGRSEAGRAG